jgi:hypothetical protein
MANHLCHPRNGRSDEASLISGPIAKTMISMLDLSKCCSFDRERL